MRKLLTFLIALGAIVFAVGAPALAQIGVAFPGPGMPAANAGPPPGCSQATAFLARTSGLDGTHTMAYTNLICGLVTD
jgi:hypothetical protein